MPILQQISPANALAYKTVRLHALKDSPTAFGSTYAQESQLADADWIKRATEWTGETAIGYVAMEGESPCAMAAGFLDEDDPAKAHLISMWVAPRHRRSGIGAALVGTILAWAEDRHARALHLTVTNTNRAAIKFYEYLGFRKTGRTCPYPNDPALFEYEMAQVVGSVVD